MTAHSCTELRPSECFRCDLAVVESSVDPHPCDNGDVDRIACPEPCGTHHVFCTLCGDMQDTCVLDDL